MRFRRGDGHDAQQASGHPGRAVLEYGGGNADAPAQRRQRHRFPGAVHQQRRGRGHARSFPPHTVRGRAPRAAHREDGLQVSFRMKNRAVGSKGADCFLRAQGRLFFGSGVSLFGPTLP